MILEKILYKVNITAEQKSKPEFHVSMLKCSCCVEV